MFIMAIICALLLFASGMASVFETSLTAANRLKIKVLAEDGNKKAQKIMKLLAKYDLVITAIVVFDNLINIILPTISLLFMIEIFHNESIAATLSTIIMSILIIFAGELIPKLYGRFYAQKALFTFITPLQILVSVFYPIAIIINKITDLIKKYLFPNYKTKDDFDEEIITMINEEHEQGNLEKNQKDLIKKAIIFNDKTVSNIMQPNNKVIMIDKQASNNSIYKTLITNRYSRYPVYENENDNIVGILNERDFLLYYAKDKNFDKNKVISDPLIVPDTLKIAVLLPEMQKGKQQLAIAVDEYGTMLGIISIEDIIEELVGEVWDERDEVIKKIRKLRPNQYLLQSDVLLSDLEDIVDIKSEKDMTIARFLLDYLEKIPMVGDEYHKDNYRLEVVKVEDNSIEEVLLTLLYSKNEHLIQSI